MTPARPRLTALHRSVDRHATGVRVAAAGVLWVALAVGILVLQARVASVTGGLAVPDVSVFYTPADLYSLLDQYGESGRRAFLVFSLFDVVYPFAAYGFAALLLAALARPAINGHPALACTMLLPVLGLVVELLEQVGFLLVLLAFPTRLWAVAWATSALSAIKLALLLLLVLVVVGMIGWRMCRAFRRQRRASQRCG